MQLLNLGCGQRFHQSWINVDFVSGDPLVIAHNLLRGIPFESNRFDVVYHSHVLEHFSKKDGKFFISECFRVLKKGGILRIAVPDLEIIAREYIRNLEMALEGNEMAQQNYEWIKLELYDQTVRNESGGEMAAYFLQDNIPNEQYVFERVGEEGKNIRKKYLQDKKGENLMRIPDKDIPKNFKSFARKIGIKISNLIFRKRNDHFKRLQTELAIGKFRLGGEIHQWMYDRYSLAKLLSEEGFEQVTIRDAFSSTINCWNAFELESKNGIVFKPDSLFIEASKP